MVEGHDGCEDECSGHGCHQQCINYDPSHPRSPAPIRPFPHSNHQKGRKCQQRRDRPTRQNCHQSVPRQQQTKRLRGVNHNPANHQYHRHTRRDQARQCENQSPQFGGRFSAVAHRVGLVGPLWAWIDEGGFYLW